VSAVHPHRSSTEQIAQNVLEKNRQRIIDEAAQRKAADCDKNLEIEKIKRQMFNLIDRLDGLKDK